jgi:hypothetical protein
VTEEDSENEYLQTSTCLAPLGPLVPVPVVPVSPPAKYGCCAADSEVEEMAGDWGCDSCQKKIHWACQQASSGGGGLYTCSKCFTGIMAGGRSRRMI